MANTNASPQSLKCQCLHTYIFILFKENQGKNNPNITANLVLKWVGKLRDLGLSFLWEVLCTFLFGASTTVLEWSIHIKNRSRYNQAYVHTYAHQIATQSFIAFYCSLCVYVDIFFGNAEQKKGHHLQHLKNKMSLIPWSMKLALVCAEGDSATMVDFFSSSSTALCTGQLEKWSNY